MELFDCEEQTMDSQLHMEAEPLGLDPSFTINQLCDFRTVAQVSFASVSHSCKIDSWSSTKGFGA
jgi:hypothetical protein